MTPKQRRQIFQINWQKADQFATVIYEAWPRIWTRDYRETNPASNGVGALNLGSLDFITSALNHSSMLPLLGILDNEILSTLLTTQIHVNTHWIWTCLNLRRGWQLLSEFCQCHSCLAVQLKWLLSSFLGFNQGILYKFRHKRVYFSSGWKQKHKRNNHENPVKNQITSKMYQK